jgi:hypothetical protein
VWCNRTSQVHMPYHARRCTYLHPMPPREWPLVLLPILKWLMMVALRLPASVGVGLNRLLLVTCSYNARSDASTHNLTQTQ